MGRPGADPVQAMTHLAAVFLDVGGTLLRERAARWEIYAGVAAEHGLAVPAERMRELMVCAHRELPLVLGGAYRYSDPWFRAFIARIFGEELGLDAPRLADATEELFHRFEDARTFRLFPGALELLDELRSRGLFLGVISNWSARLPRVLEAVGLAERIDLVLCSALERSEKPAPEMFQRALARAGVAPAQALHAGDHARKDAAGAAAVGIEPVLVDHERRLGPGDAPGVAVVRSLPELRSYILGRLP